jgi:hypothetical protein
MTVTEFTHVISADKNQQLPYWHGRAVNMSPNNLMIADRVGSNPVRGTARCFLQQKTLHPLLSTGWFQEQIQESFNKAHSFQHN